MAFVSVLLDKVKVEDPWLPPPTTWESIPSQSGTPPSSVSSSFSSSSSIHLFSDITSSSLSQVKLALNALQGVESALLTIQTLANTNTTSLALSNILKSIASSGSLVFHLFKFVDHFRSYADEENEEYSLVNQAFAVAVAKVLEGYISSLNTLYESIALRHSSGSRHQLTLLQLYSHTSNLRCQIEVVANLCNVPCGSGSFRGFFRGGDLLSYLYMQLQVADPAHRCLLKFLFLRSCEPYCQFIRSWIFKAEINDPFKEFIVEYADDKMNVKERNGVSIPCFLKQFLIPLVRAGQQLQVVMKLLELCSANHSYVDLLPCYTAFSANHPFYASPIIFKKEIVEAMIIVRKSYYKKMQDKLENFITKLEFNYQQVVLDSPEVSFFANGMDGEALDMAELNDKMIATSAADERRSNVAAGDEDFDDSSLNDEDIYGDDTSEASSSSSLSGAEEHTESQKLIEHHNNVPVMKNSCLPDLTLSTYAPSNTLQKSLQTASTVNIDSISHENPERKGSLVHIKDSQHQRTIFSSMGLQPKLEDSRFLCGDVQYAGGLPYKSWPLRSLLNNPFDVGGYRNDLELQPEDSGIELSEANLGDCNNPLKSGITSAVQSVNSHSTSTFFMMQKGQLNCESNILSMNPMLTRKALFLLSKPDEICNVDCVRSLPCFDFSSVEDPFKVAIEKLTNSTEYVLNEGSTDSAVSVGLVIPSEPDNGSIDNLIDSSKVSCIYPSLELKDGNSDAVSTYISGRSSWRSLLFVSSFADKYNIGDLTQDFTSIFETPLEFIIDKCLLQEILLQYNYVSKLTIKLLEEGFDLRGHLLSLRQYHFMELADWADLLIMSLRRHQSCVTEPDHRVSEIQGFLELSVQRSSCEMDHYKDRLFVYLKGHEMPLSTAETGIRSFDFLGLGYRIDWPISIVLTPDALKIYADIFSFLIQLKLAVFSVNDVWCSLKDLMQLINQDRHSTQYKRELGHLNLLVKLRHQVNHFVSTLQQYVHSQLSHVSWCRLLHSLKHKVKDMMDLESVHMAYLNDSLDICFLSSESRAVAGIIESILQCALDFGSCLTRGIWDADIHEDNLTGKLSRINISQVHAIKQKLNKSLRELHLCYLKSPKYGEFGLSRFWGYLNYNEYYSDVVRKTAGLYTFPV